jgi:GNAT superfamily N-acetyltransferase
MGSAAGRRVTRTVAGLALVEREEAHGRLRLALVDHANGFSRDASALTIDRLELHDGTGALVRVDGIGNVATLEAYRGRGLASELIDIAIERMRQGDAAGSLLYGIDGFYEPFGWKSCGDERWVTFEVARGRAERVDSPAGSRAHAREMTEDDRARVAELYERLAAATVGAVARTGPVRTWSLLDPGDVTIVERGGELVGWAWRGADLDSRTSAQHDLPGMAAFVELQAVDVDAAWHVLQAARAMVGASQESSLARLATGAPDRHPLRELARSEWLDAQLIDVVRPHGGAMLLPFTDAASRLVHGTFQFLPDRF